MANGNQWRGNGGILANLPKGVRMTLQKQPHIESIRNGVKEAKAAEAARKVVRSDRERSESND